MTLREAAQAVVDSCTGFDGIEMAPTRSSVEALRVALAETPPAAAGEGVLVGGEFMERSIQDFVRACQVTLEREQAKPAPDTALIALLCDAVRLSRENERMAASGIPAAQPADDEIEPYGQACEACIDECGKSDHYGKNDVYFDPPAQPAVSEEEVEKYITSLPWSPNATEDEKTLVAGNIRAFAARLRGEGK